MKALFVDDHHLILMCGKKGLHIFRIISSSFRLFKILIYFFLTGLGLCCCARAFSSCGEWGLLTSCRAWSSHGRTRSKTDNLSHKIFKTIACVISSYPLLAKANIRTVSKSLVPGSLFKPREGHGEWMCLEQ